MDNAGTICNNLTVFLKPEDTLQEAIVSFSRARLDAIPVVSEENEVLGVMTKHNLYKALLNKLSMDTPLADLYTRPAICVGEEDPFEKVYMTIVRKRIGQVVVTKPEHKPVGMVTKLNLIDKLHNRSERMAGELASLLDALENGVLAINRRKIITVLNPAAEKMLGVESKNMLGREITTVLPEIKLSDILFTGTVKNCKTIAGSPGVVAKYLPVFRHGIINGAIAVLHDLREYEQVAQELESVKKLQQTFATVLEMAYDGLLVIDQNGTITTANRSILEFLQLRQKDLLGKKVQSIMPELELEEIIHTGLRDQGDVRIIRGIRCIVTRLPMINDGKVMGAVAKVTFRDLHRLTDLVNRLEKLENQISFYRDELSRVSHHDLRLDDIVGDSPVIQQVKNMCRLAAQSISTVLLIGESGTGKGIFASAIHNESGRPGPFIKVNCAALPENLLESEFFGYEAGAFTGARKGGKPGKFELADGGTLLLDEIGDMSPSLQAKILRVLQEREFERVGGTKTISVNVRVIAATNRDLEQLITEGKFREDLYYRLNVITVSIPPLRERVDDLPSLSSYFIMKYNEILDAKVTGLDSETMKLFMQHHWRGNVRELENVIERALNITQEGKIISMHLPQYLQNPSGVKPVKPQVTGTDQIDLFSTVASAEKEMILRAIEKAEGNRTKAAQLLSISRTCLYKKLRQHNIQYKR
ncbi:MAG: CBS domain-containing protein [Firmicutes bacterium]|nr:CBS domain-containing protein [Bacillota bacterium]